MVWNLPHHCRESLTQRRQLPRGYVEKFRQFRKAIPSHERGRSLSQRFLAALLDSARMVLSDSTSKEATNSRLNWSIVYLSTPIIGIVGAMLVMHKPPIIESKAILLLAVVGVGIIVCMLVNWLRPRYELSVGRTRRVYDFLLRQFPPPD